MKEKLFSIVIGVVCTFLMLSCESDKPSFETSSRNDINTWIYDELFMPNYLWDVTNNPNYALDPIGFFNSLKNRNDAVSKIQETTTTSTTYYDIGFEYGANRYSDGKIYYVVYYVKPQSNAELQGLKRGYIITSVNGNEINDEESAKTLLLNAYSGGESVVLTYVIPPESDLITVRIRPQVVSTENPLYTTNSVNWGTGKKVGYMLYNSFTAGYSGQPNAYNDALAKKFQDFMNDGIDYLVLDLRYNAGGSLESAAVLASAIVKDRQADAPFFVFKRIREGLKDIASIKLVDQTKSGVEIPKLGNNLKGIYIITGNYTSAASEAFINSIMSYRTDITIVGEKTAGSASSNIAVGSSSKYEYEWDLALAYIANKAGNYNYGAGIIPDISIREVPENESVLLYPLGDESEIVFYKILTLIAGLRNTQTSVDSERGAQSISSSITNKPWANKSIIEFSNMK